MPPEGVKTKKMTTREHISLESVLRNPDTVSSVHRGHLATLRSGKLQERQAIAHLHVLKLLLGQKYDTIVNESVLGALRQKVKEGECDRLTLDDVEQKGVATFETIKGDKVTGFHVYERGLLVVASHAVDGRVAAKTMYSIFNDPEQQRHASQGQHYMHAIAEYARNTATDLGIINILEKCKTMEPTYSKGKLLGNLFLADAKDLHDTFRETPTLEGKYALLRDKAAIDLVLGFYANAFEQTAQGKKLAKRNGGQAFKSRDHEQLFYEKILLRANPALKNFFVREGIADASGRIINMAKLRAKQGEEARLIKALGLRGTEGMVFSHGDNLPPNTMVAKDRTGKTTYTPIDFEFACKDFIENYLVQCWTKAGIYDHSGASLTMEDGRSIEDALLQDSAAVMRKLDSQFDEAQFRQRFHRLKAENYLLWAARYHHYSKSKHVKNPVETHALMRYYTTLFVKEIVHQGLANDENDTLFSCIKTMFGEPLPGAVMQDIHDRYLPDERSHSVLRTDFDINAEEKLEEMVQKHKSSQRKRKLGMISGIATAAALVLGLTFTAGRYREQIREFEFKEETATLNDEWNRMYNIFLSDSDPRIEKETEMYKLMERTYGRGNTAVAAVYAPELVKKIVQHYQTTEWPVVEAHLPHLLVQQMRLYTHVYIDSWMRMSPTGIHSDKYIPPYIDSSARVFANYYPCPPFDEKTGELCPLTPETRAGKKPQFGDQYRLEALKKDPWYQVPFAQRQAQFQSKVRKAPNIWAAH